MKRGFFQENKGKLFCVAALTILTMALVDCAPPTTQSSVATSDPLKDPCVSSSLHPVPNPLCGQDIAQAIEPPNVARTVEGAYRQQLSFENGGFIHNVDPKVMALTQFISSSEFRQLFQAGASGVLEPLDAFGRDSKGQLNRPDGQILVFSPKSDADYDVLLNKLAADGVPLRVAIGDQNFAAYNLAAAQPGEVVLAFEKDIGAANIIELRDGQSFKDAGKQLIMVDAPFDQRALDAVKRNGLKIGTVQVVSPNPDPNVNNWLWEPPVVKGIEEGVIEELVTVSNDADGPYGFHLAVDSGLTAKSTVFNLFKEDADGNTSVHDYPYGSYHFGQGNDIIRQLTNKPTSAENQARIDQQRRMSDLSGLYKVYEVHWTKAGQR